MISYAAFLRGINVGGNTMVKMEELKNTFQSLGLQNVKTLLNSGNVLFDASEENAGRLGIEIENALNKRFGFEITVFLREKSRIEALVRSDPFHGIPVTPDTRLYVTFLSEKPAPRIAVPYISADGDLQILRVTDGEVCSSLVLSPKRGTVDLMSFIEKEFGRRVTTRNWNTILKINK